jgi:hypothetical protein
MSTVAMRRLIFVMIVGTVITFPICIWAPERLYKPAFAVLCICSWGPVIVLHYNRRRSSNGR